MLKTEPECEMPECVKESEVVEVQQSGLTISENVLSLIPCSDTTLPCQSKQKNPLWKVLEEYLEVGSNCSESDSNQEDEEFDDDSSHCEEVTDDVSPALTCYEQISLLNWSIPNSFSAKTLPGGLSIRCSDLPNAVLGVFAVKQIEKDTVFGPYVGVSTFDKDLSDISDRVWKIYINKKLHHFIDGRDPETSNWMTYVNYAGRGEGQNLESFQFQYKVYYKAIRDIRPGKELLVWPAKKYNQDCLGAGDKLKELIDYKASLSQNGNERRDLGCPSFPDVAMEVNRMFKSEPADAMEAEEERPTDETENRKTSYKCNVCGKSFGRLHYLIRHAMMRTCEKPYRCDLCSAAFTHNSYLREHSRSHTGEKPFKCDICNVSFTRESNLRVHARIHSSEKPFKCDACPASFANKSHLRGHSSVHTGIKPFKCIMCAAAFARNSDLRRHTMTHTGEKPFACSVCNVSFSQKSVLKEHSRTHTGEKPYKCGICNASFASKSYFKEHRNIHIGVMPHKCNVCNAAFTYKCSWLKHMKTHRNRELLQNHVLENSR